MLWEILGWTKVSGGISLGFWPMKCALGWDFYERLWGSMALPVVLMCFTVMYSFIRCRLAREAHWVQQAFVTGCCVMIVHLMFPSTIKALLLVFDCHVVEDVGSFVRAEMSLECTSGMHYFAASMASAWLLVWGMAVPYAVFKMGNEAHAHLHSQARFKFLYVGYRKGCKWWESMVLIRKLFLSCVTVFVLSTMPQGMQL